MTPDLNIRPFEAPPAVELDALPEDVLAFYGRISAPEWAWMSNFEGGPVQLPGTNLLGRAHMAVRAELQGLDNG